MPKERRLGFGEGYSVFCHDYAAGTTMLTGALQVKGPLNGELAGQALSMMQKRHPMLRARFIKKDNGRDCFSFDEDAQSTPLMVITRSSVNHWVDIHQEQYKRPFKDSDNYLWRAVLLENKEQEASEHELVVAFHHATSDGISVARFFKDFIGGCFALVAGNDQDTTPLPVMPPVEELLNQRASWPGWIARNAIGGAFYARARNHLYRYESFAPLEQRRTRHAYRELGHECLHPLLNLCREHGVTLTALLSGSLMKACHQTLGRSRGASKQIAFTPFSLRGRCDPPVGDEHLGCFVGFANTPYSVEQDSDIWDLAAGYGKQLARAIKRDVLMPADFRKSLAARFLTSFDKGFLSDAFQYGIGVTNIGRLGFNARHGPFEITKLHFGTCRNWGDWLMLVHTSSLEDRLFFCSCYAEPLLGMDNAETIMDKFISILMDTAKTTERELSRLRTI